MRVTDEGKAGEVLKSGLASGGIELFRQAVAAYALRNLKIQQMWNM